MGGSNVGKLSEGLGWKVRVRANGHLGYLIEDCIDGMVITDNEDGTTEVEGLLADLPEVYGFIIRLRDAVVFLDSLQVTRIDIESPV